jgi:hypothetical protein
MVKPFTPCCCSSSNARLIECVTAQQVHRRWRRRGLHVGLSSPPTVKKMAAPTNTIPCGLVCTNATAMVTRTARRQTLMFSHAGTHARAPPTTRLRPLRSGQGPHWAAVLFPLPVAAAAPVVVVVVVVAARAYVAVIAVVSFRTRRPPLSCHWTGRPRSGRTAPA